MELTVRQSAADVAISRRSDRMHFIAVEKILGRWAEQSVGSSLQKSVR